MEGEDSRFPPGGLVDLLPSRGEKAKKLAGPGLISMTDVATGASRKGRKLQWEKKEG